jgi:hypothetical protein
MSSISSPLPPSSLVFDRTRRTRWYDDLGQRLVCDLFVINPVNVSWCSICFEHNISPGNGGFVSGVVNRRRLASNRLSGGKPVFNASNDHRAMTLKHMKHLNGCFVVVKRNGGLGTNLDNLYQRSRTSEALFANKNLLPIATPLNPTFFIHAGFVHPRAIVWWPCDPKPR